MTTCSDLKSGGLVAISGAGPAGLTLARILQQRGFTVTVFERDASRTARRQGGSLDLRRDSGQLAVDAAGLSEAFARVSRDEARAFKMMDETGQVLFAVDAEHNDEAGPEVDRGDLRDLLLDSLAPGTVSWGHVVTDVSPEPDGRWRVEFAGHEPVVADLVVGADGLGSRVRPHLTDTRPEYYGLTMIDGYIREDLWRAATGPGGAESDIADLVGEGSVLISGTRKTVFVQRCNRDVIRLYFSMEIPADWPAGEGFDLTDSDAVLAAIRAEYADWSPALMATLTQVEGGFQRWPLHVLPPGHTWTSIPGLTMIGDASHAMPPFTGKGVNLAMLDAVTLAGGLTEGGDAPLAEVVAAFEAGMQAQTLRETGECMDRGLEIYGVDMGFGPAPAAPSHAAPAHAEPAQAA